MCKVNVAVLKLDTCVASLSVLISTYCIPLLFICHNFGCVSVVYVEDINFEIIAKNDEFLQR